MKPQFFGPENSKLFGTFHAARGGVRSPVRAMVICPPIGQEYIRTHWCLRLLAGQLARKGISVLRFDYFGIGDSMGSPGIIDSIQRWQSDIHNAIGFLQAELGVQAVTLFGLRTGATLATSVARGCPEVHSLLLWEPVWDSAKFLDEMRQMHTEMLDLWVCKMQTENSIRAEEILGFRYSRPMLNELEQLQVDWQSIEQPHLVFDTHDIREGYGDLDNNRMRKVEFTKDEVSWNDLRQLETAWLRPETSRKIVTGAADLFERLERFEILVDSAMEVTS